MPIIRGHHSFDDYFTKIPNEWVRDNRLSFKARGLLTLVMSHSSGWSLSINALAEQNQEGRDAIRSAIAELETLGYLSREQVNEGGRFGESVWITHNPLEPMTDLPMTENPMTENPTTKKNNLKEEQIKNNTSELFDEFWKVYPRKEGKKPAFKAFRSALSRTSFEDILAGIEAYKRSDRVRRGFIKLPATWLNEDAWEDAATQVQTESYGSERREREIQRSREQLEEIKAQESKSAAPPKCPHGENLALCRRCLQ